MGTKRGNLRPARALLGLVGSLCTIAAVSAFADARPSVQSTGLGPCVRPSDPLPFCSELRFTEAQKQCFIQQSQYYRALIAHYHTLNVCRSTSFRIDPTTRQRVLYCDTRPVAEIPNWYFKDYSDLCRQ
jgi:hypothetical protein